MDAWVWQFAFQNRENKQGNRFKLQIPGKARKILSTEAVAVL